ncbi:hypothetical protein HYALB_00012725 [Hymenoscyphus albidus]|uniref:DUF5672 domain-containing protein n=1 Tax=Hymenoscyphus albidus TaxID=595503 RepID=A0A9N9LSW7_9HELO|nr:hypothetical protein HYALB_00012725 [Hymenoscyphus albidus]
MIAVPSLLYKRQLFGLGFLILTALLWHFNSTSWYGSQDVVGSLTVFQPGLQPAVEAEVVPKLDTTWHKQIASEMATEKMDLKAVRTPHGLLDRTKVALLIESRPLPYLIPLLVHFISVVPPEWSFRFMGSDKSVNMLEANPTIRRYVRMKKLFIDPVPKELSINGFIGDYGHMNHLLTHTYFYEEWLWPAEWLFYFQDDSMICSAAKRTLNDFVNEGYSLIGASHEGNDVSEIIGGFTLRYIPHFVKQIHTLSFHDYEKVGGMPSEDAYFMSTMKNLTDARIANVSEAIRFGVVNDWNKDPEEMPMGFHTYSEGGMFRSKNGQEHQKKAYAYCPELAIISVGRWDCQCSRNPLQPGGLGG